MQENLLLRLASATLGWSKKSPKVAMNTQSRTTRVTLSSLNAPWPRRGLQNPRCRGWQNY